MHVFVDTKDLVSGLIKRNSKPGRIVKVIFKGMSCLLIDIKISLI